MTSQSIVDDIRGRVDALAQVLDARSSDYRGALEDLNRRAEAISESSTHSWLGYQSELYYGEFEKPPPSDQFSMEWGLRDRQRTRWKARTYEEVEQAITADHSGVPFEAVARNVDELIKEAQSLRDDMLTELSFIHGRQGLERESEMLIELENFTWGITARQYARQFLRESVISRDMIALQQPTKAPPHLVFQSKVVSVMSELGAVEDFVKKSRRLLRQVEIRESTSLTLADVIADFRQVLLIVDRFHLVARQLRVRHAARVTLAVEDEYDVQDLLHTLLKIYIDDVRAEEWTPSYAGGASRMDFILRQQQIVIEVKKTRAGLADKEIGEQLIIDIAKYQQHPDCRTLLCFVYDPEGRVGNPRGLESDLALLSSDRVKVVVAIRPA